MHSQDSNCITNLIIVRWKDTTVNLISIIICAKQNRREENKNTQNIISLQSLSSLCFFIFHFSVHSHKIHNKIQLRLLAILKSVPELPFPCSQVGDSLSVILEPSPSNWWKRMQRPRTKLQAKLRNPVEPGGGGQDHAGGIKLLHLIESSMWFLNVLGKFHNTVG